MENNILRKEHSLQSTSSDNISFLRQSSPTILTVADPLIPVKPPAVDLLREFLAADPGPFIAQKKIRELDRSEIINKIHYLHFTESTVNIFLKTNNGMRRMKAAKIHAISDKKIICRWLEIPKLNIDGNNEYRIAAIGIDTEKSFILCSSTARLKDDHLFNLSYPEKAWQIDRRSVRRHSCNGVKIGIQYFNKLFIGKLLDFNTFGIKVRFPSSFNLPVKNNTLNEKVAITFMPGTKNQFAAVYKITRYEMDDQEKSKINIIFALDLQSDHTVAEAKYIRNPRLNLVPAPRLSFYHPLLQRNLDLKIENISSSGICAFEELEECIVIPGLIIDNGEIVFNQKVRIKCSLKAICHFDGKNKIIRWGFAITDIHPRYYGQMMQILTNALDSNVFLNSKINSEMLWKFFFDANFIYEKKYNHLATIRKPIRTIYDILYQKNPEISMHLTYQKNKFIYGHFSALHAYEDAWIQHHHAAKATDNRPIGLIMLKHLIHYFKDMHRFPSLKANYLMGYFRPENKFPQRIFGGFYQYLSNRKICSMDLFAYIENNRPILFHQLPKDWTLRLAVQKDLEILDDYYEKESGGLLLEAIGIEKGHFKKEFIESLYEKNGFFRRLRIHALYLYDNIQAIFIVEQSNAGLNLSDLLNHIKIILIKPEKIPWKILKVSIFKLIKKYQMGFVPVLIFPTDYVKLNDIQCNKNYQFWICQTKFYYRIVEYLNLKLRFTYWN